jgi:hypothetical protein
MEINYTPVTHADRISNLTNPNNLTLENKSNVHWGKMITITFFGVIAIIYLSEYFNRKKKELEGK